MQYIVPNSINNKNIIFRKVKTKNKKDYIYKIYYMYGSIELIGIPYKIDKNDYEQQNDKIILKNERDTTLINELNNHIVKSFPECLPIIQKNKISHSHLLQTQNKDLYLFISYISTYKYNKKAKIYFIYD